MAVSEQPYVVTAKGILAGIEAGKVKANISGAPALSEAHISHPCNTPSSLQLHNTNANQAVHGRLDQTSAATASCKPCATAAIAVLAANIRVLSTDCLLWCCAYTSPPCRSCRCTQRSHVTRTLWLMFPPALQ
eukprot:TRINITY_DN15196_c0_g1_i1.p1 TRINITY_DN15196_c0_g1~~TRINITY_DN15196_c0_g1_i1.p1  ORF type:complete len:133 (+),score=0.60 TRINITY_DN15196_c0_g1_i1:506-904(+)